jgi:hypothetical protein
MRRRPGAPNGESYVQTTSAASTIWYMSGRQGPWAAALPADGLAILAVIGGATVDAADGLLAKRSQGRARIGSVRHEFNRLEAPQSRSERS